MKPQRITQKLLNTLPAGIAPQVKRMASEYHCTVVAVIPIWRVAMPKTQDNATDSYIDDAGSVRVYFDSPNYRMQIFIWK